MTDSFTSPDGTRLAFCDEGRGKALLCLAGLTRTMADFDDLAPHLPGVRMIRIDARGRGASDWTGAASYTVLQEARDVLALMDHLHLPQVAVLGTSRGGLIGMMLAVLAKGRLAGLCLNDVGPQLERTGLERIGATIGRDPGARSHGDLAARMPGLMPGFANVPQARWLADVQRRYVQAEGGLQINYDPALREAFAAALAAPPVDSWPLFDALQGLPLALIRGANSDLLSPQTAAEMRRRRPDMIFAEVADRAHVPFLDEPESLTAIHRFLEQVP